MSVERIDSQKHPVMQTLRELQTEKGRLEHESFIVEGTMLVHRALEYGIKVRSVVFTDKYSSQPEANVIFCDAATQGVAVYEVSEGLMTKVVPGRPTPGVVAVVERRLFDTYSLLVGPSPLIILIDQCENPDNLGMLLRSLDAAGVDGVVLTSDSVDPFSKLCVRASRGAVLSLRLATVDKPEEWIARAKETGYRVLASSAHGTQTIWTADFTGSAIVVVGNEHTGVRQSIRQMADSVVVIPMKGRMESLNIAVAGAIMAYEAARQRGVAF